MTERKIRVAAFIPGFHCDEYRLIRDAVRKAEDLGADIVYTTDHFFPQRGDPHGANFECWSMLAAWAEQTTTIEFGALVTSNSYRNPDLLADMARTVDNISGGRMILGIGSGWQERDYLEYGYEVGTAGSRLDDLRLALPRIQKRWDLLRPPPTRQIPILIGGGGPKKTLRITAEFADIWHFFFFDVESYRAKADILAAHCADVGRDPKEIEHSAEVSEVVDHIAFAEALYEAGVSQFNVAVAPPELDDSKLRDVIKWRDHMNAT